MRSRVYIVYSSRTRVGREPSGVSWTVELQLRAGRTSGHHPSPPLPQLEKALFSGNRMADPALEAALEIKLKGNVLFKENNFEEAIKLYSQAIDACPKHRYE